MDTKEELNNKTDMIKLTELNGNVIELEISEIKLYRGTDYGTFIEMKDNSEFMVKEDFDKIDEIIDL